MVDVLLGMVDEELVGTNLGFRFGCAGFTPKNLEGTQMYVHSIRDILLAMC